MRLYEEFVAYEREKIPLAQHPDVDLVRFVELEDWAKAQVDCMTEAGFGARIGGQGGVFYDPVPKEQSEALNVAVYTCDVKYPMDPRLQLPLPRVRAEQQYHFLVEEVRSCVESHGAAVSEPPTLETWLAGYYAQGAGVAAPWHPIDEAVDAAGHKESTLLDQLWDDCGYWSPDLYPPIALGSSR